MAVTTFKRDEDVPPCQLTKADFIRLVRMATEHVKTPQSSVTISTTVGDATIEAETLRPPA